LIFLDLYLEGIVMIKTIIFDIGGVLIGYNWMDFLMQLFNDEQKAKQLRENIFKHWNEVDRGVISDEELLELFASDAPDLKDDIKYFWDHIGEALWQFDFTKDWLKELKARGYQLLYLSNWSNHVRECALKQLDFIPLMDGGIFSYEVKLIKPDHEIYKEIIRKYDLNPAECVFLDDKLANCEAARECGLHAVQVVDHNHDIALEGLEKILGE
jgi:putative hydrolase of the HAD superfamily